MVKAVTQALVLAQLSGLCPIQMDSYSEAMGLCGLFDTSLSAIFVFTYSPQKGKKVL